MIKGLPEGFGPPDDKARIITVTCILAAVIFQILSHLGIDCLVGLCLVQTTDWPLYAFGFVTAIGFTAVAVHNLLDWLELVYGCLADN